MSGNPNNFTDGTLVGIVVGGDINDPASDQSCNMKVFIPGMHGKDVKVEHLAFSTMMKSPTKSSQSTFEGTLDPGSIVFVRKDTGSNQCHIIGTGNEIYDPSARVPGNIDLLAIDSIRKAINRTLDIRIPPNVTETMVDGVKVRKVQEKGKLHSHSLLQGIPANGAIYNLSGAIVPQVKGIATATQVAANILTPALAALIPGANISIGNLLGSITSGTLLGGLAGSVVGDIAGDLLGDVAGDVAGAIAGVVVAGTVSTVSSKMLKELSKEMFSKLTPQTQMSLRSMSTLSQSIETSSGGGFSSGGKMDPVTFLTNATNLLGQCGNVGDIVKAMQMLQYDTSLHGIDKLPSVSFNMSTPFGIPMPMSLSPSGVISSIAPKALQTAIDAFSGAMGSASAFPGVNVGENLFGESSKTMFEMFGRLSGANQSKAIALAKVLNQSGVAQNFDKVLKQTVGGGNPLQILLNP
jgi:hypothetical protein